MVSPVVMLSVWRRGITTAVSVRQRAALRRSLAAVDVAAPPSLLLDVESVGMNARETDFTLFPQFELAPLISQLVREKRQIDLIANLVHRAVHVIETNDIDQRDDRRQHFQSAMYAAVFRLLSNGDSGGYIPFGIFDRKMFESVAPKIHPTKREIITKLISQPLLRITTLNRDIVFGPNRVMENTGVDGFRSVMDLFLLDLRLLNGRNLDRLLDSMKSHKRGEVHFELLRVWALVWDESAGVDTPPVKGSKWTLRRVLAQVILKQSKDMLIRLLADSGSCRDEVFAICRSRFNLTGMPKYPWANEIVEEWLIERRLGIDDGRMVVQSVAAVCVGTVPVLAPSDSVGWNVNDSGSNKGGFADSTFLVNTDAKLTRMKERLLSKSMTDSVVGISFVVNSVLSVSTADESFVIDLSTVNPVFVRFLVKKLLNGSQSKVVYSLESFLDKLQSSLGVTDGVHFENVVDLRRGRIRRTLEQTHASDNDVPEASLPGIIESPDFNSQQQLRESVLHIFGRTPLRDLIAEHLGRDHDRALAFNPSVWDYRPLSPQLLEFAANDSRLLVNLEEAFRSNGFLPTEILSFDPFSESE